METFVITQLQCSLFCFLVTLFFTVACGEFYGHSPPEDWDICGSSRITDPPDRLEERGRIKKEPLEQGPTIIYVPTRKETLRIAKYLCGFGVKAAAYNAAVCIHKLITSSPFR